MSQQINLLSQTQPEPGLSAVRALSGLGILLAAFIGYAVFAGFSTAELEEAAARGNAQLAADKAMLKSFEQKIAARPKLADIDTQIGALKAHAAESQQILNVLRNDGGGSQGYSRYLTTLAQVAEDGVWLTGIKIGNAGKAVNIAGRSLRQESVLRYAQRLNEKFSAYGVQFSAIELTLDVVKEDGSGPGLSAVAFKLN